MSVARHIFAGAGALLFAAALAVRPALGADLPPVKQHPGVVPTAPVVSPPPARAPGPRLPTAPLPRISVMSPSPAVVGRRLVIRGMNFGDRGRAQLNIGGLRLVLPQTQWTATQITVTIPDQLTSMVGESRKSGRLWLYAPQGTATSAIVVGPDLATLVPQITRLSSDQLALGAEVTISGRHFLRERRGAVGLRCPGPGLRASGQVQSWSDNQVRVTFTARVRRPLSHVPCELTLRNHAGLTTSRPVTLSVPFGREELTYHVRLRQEIPRQNPARLGVFEVGRAVQLINGWHIRGTRVSFTHEADWRHMRVHWMTRPAVGSTNGFAVIHVSPPDMPGVPDRYPREMRYTVEITGPAGLPYLAR